MDVVHNPEKNRFEVPLAGATAVLEYRQENGTLTITHTYVPNASRGHGIASRMTKAALEYARAHKLHVIPHCSFAVSYLALRERRTRRT